MASEGSVGSYMYASGINATSCNGSSCYEPVDQGDHQSPHPQLVVMISKIVAFVINIVVTIIGNTIVITIILKNKNMRTTTYYYLMNLAIADIIIAAFTEWTFLAGHLKAYWPFGHFMCKFSSFVQGVSVHVSILTLMVVAGDRYIAILHPIKSRVVKRNAWLVIAIVWVLSIGFNIPILRFTHYVVYEGYPPFCVEHWGVIGDASKNLVLYREIYTVIIFVMVYVLPLVIMSVTYIAIGQTLRSRSAIGPGTSVKATVSVQDRARRKVVKMMIVVVITFALCWMPYQLYQLYTEWYAYHMGQVASQVADPHVFFFVIWLGYANSAMNPFIYCGFNENFRRGFRDAFTGRWFFSRTSHEELKPHNGAPSRTLTTTITHTEHNDPTTLESML